MTMLKPFYSFITIFFFIFSFSTIVLFPSVHGEDDELYTACRNNTFDCGVLKNISYPFWWGPPNLGRPRHCGRQGFQLTCMENQLPLIKMEDQDFRVLEISKDSSTTTIARADLFESPCTSKLVNTTLDYDRFSYLPSVRNLTLYYGCPPENESIPNNFTCKVAGTDKETSYYVGDSIARLPHPNRDTCYKNISVPTVWTEFSEVAPEDATADALIRVLKQGFPVEYTADWDLCGACLVSHGMCGSSETNDEFLCFCGDKPHDRTCPIRGGGTSYWKIKVIIGATTAGSSILLMVIIFKIWLRTKDDEVFQAFIRNDEDLEAFIRNNGPLTVKRYRYSDIKKMTNSFKDKLGQGGYGDVYKGKLLDGCLVAVKVLNPSKGNGEDFINEVASISRTSHVNVVTLLGYCYQGQKKALIYEFMPNGSLEKYIYKGNSLNTTLHLEVEKLFEISIGIARGLEYLHRGCNTRILHFDIKPHNILLDEGFCPKISDFGLSKLCLKKESIVSMLDARGTIGYIAPEVFSRNFGRVSVKSDVYSYGMMILEIVGGRKNANARVSHTSEIYFPDWVYQHLEPGSNLGLPNPMSELDNEVARKMILVGLWCIQTKPSDRPSMSKVIEMLEGSIEALQIPPKPILTSPPRTPTESSTLSLTF